MDVTTAVRQKSSGQPLLPHMQYDKHSSNSTMMWLHETRFNSNCSATHEAATSQLRHLGVGSRPCLPDLGSACHAAVICQHKAFQDASTVQAAGLANDQVVASLPLLLAPRALVVGVVGVQLVGMVVKVSLGPGTPVGGGATLHSSNKFHSGWCGWQARIEEDGNGQACLHGCE